MGVPFKIEQGKGRNGVGNYLREQRDDIAAKVYLISRPLPLRGYRFGSK